MAGGSKNHRRILGREPWSAAQKRSWGRKTRRALQLAPLFVSLDRADAIIEGARYIVPACPECGGEGVHILGYLSTICRAAPVAPACPSLGRHPAGVLSLPGKPIGIGASLAPSFRAESAGSSLPSVASVATDAGRRSRGIPLRCKSRLSRHSEHTLVPFVPLTRIFRGSIGVKRAPYSDADFPHPPV